MISNKTKEVVWALYETEHLTKTEIARRLGISRGKVIEILKQPKYKNEQLLDNINKINAEHNESLLKYLRKDDRPRQILDKVLDIINDDVRLEAELSKQNGFRNIVGAMKIVIDTGATANKDKREHDKAEQESILNTTEVMNDNFEIAMMKAVETPLEDYHSLIEEDSLEEIPVS